MENLERQESPESHRDLVGLESIQVNLVTGCCNWRGDIESLQSLCVAKSRKKRALSRKHLFDTERCPKWLGQWFQ